jgi:hypothetical protein
MHLGADGAVNLRDSITSAILVLEAEIDAAGGADKFLDDLTKRVRQLPRHPRPYF